MQQINFTKLDGLTALTVYHFKGGNLFDGMPVLLERNRRTPLKEAVLKSYSIGEVVNDITGYGKYSKSSIEVEVDGKQISWPFSMVYISE